MNYTTTKRIAFAGWSTGGHVVPISTLIKEFRAQSNVWGNDKDLSSVKLYRFGEANSMEERECKMLASTATLEFVSIVSGKLRRKPDIKEFLQNIVDSILFGYGIIISLFFLWKYRITIIFSKWGFVSLPVVIAWWLLSIPIVVHESDSKAGISTKIAAKFASKIFTGFPDTLAGSEYVWQILSSELGMVQWSPLWWSEAITHTYWEKTSILVNCGSLGSASVHEALLSLFASYPELCNNFHWTIVLGKLNGWYASDYNLFPHITCYDFIDQKTMWECYRYADISICRGGSTTLVEQHIFHIKQLIIPIPWTHDQTSNAEFFAAEYGDIVLDQKKKWRKDELWNKLKELVAYKKSAVDMGNVVQELWKGRKRIVEYLIDCLDKR